MRRTPALISAAVLVSTLAACSAADEAAGCSPVFEEADASRSVTVGGSLGSEPDVTFPVPLVTAGGSVSEPVRGEGDVLSKGEIADVQVSLYSGQTGELLTSTGYGDQSTRRVVGTDEDPLGLPLQCTRVGSRVVYTTTVAEVYGENNTQIPLAGDEALVLVYDVQRSFPGRATGAPQLGQSGMPAVVLAPDGRPGISIPAEEAPEDLRIALLRAGSGQEVAEGDSVVLHYTGVIWETDEVFDSSWERGVPATLPATASTADGGGVVPGFAEAIIGQRVGSQVLAVIPPDQGYPEGESPSGIPEGSTMVFVIDVLGIE